MAEKATVATMTIAVTEGGRHDQFKKGRKEEGFDKENRYRKDHKKPRNTSSEKKTGFVIRNKGDK